MKVCLHHCMAWLWQRLLGILPGIPSSHLLRFLAGISILRSGSIAGCWDFILLFSFNWGGGGLGGGWGVGAELSHVLQRLIALDDSAACLGWSRRSACLGWSSRGACLHACIDQVGIRLPAVRPAPHPSHHGAKTHVGGA